MQPRRPATSRAPGTSAERRHRPAPDTFHPARATRQDHDRLRGEAKVLCRDQDAPVRGHEGRWPRRQRLSLGRSKAVVGG
jgi:hypothetical protein